MNKMQAIAENHAWNNGYYYQPNEDTNLIYLLRDNRNMALTHDACNSMSFSYYQNNMYLTINIQLGVKPRFEISYCTGKMVEMYCSVNYRNSILLGTETISYDVVSIMLMSIISYEHLKPFDILKLRWCYFFYSLSSYKIM